MKIATIIGARPQFIKAAVVSKKLREKNHEIIIHTGQHYDKNMSECFFEELNIPKPDFSLGIGSASHSKQTAEMMTKIEEILLKEMPDMVLVYGDTNSTLAGALTAAKLYVPVIHIEAGLRSFDRRMPEEINRVLTDHMSELLFCPTDTAVENLKNEGIRKGVYQVGDVMCDAVRYYSDTMESGRQNEYISQLVPLYGEKNRKMDKWYLATFHRAENTDKIEKIQIVLNSLEELPYPVIFPVHPRINKYVCELLKISKYNNIFFVEPTGYKNLLYLAKYAVKVITDSGGLQKESYILNTPCVILREQTEWVETLNGNCNILTKIEKQDILYKILQINPDNSKRVPYYGNGDAAVKICDIIHQLDRK